MARERVEILSGQPGARRDYILYSILDFIVDNHVPRQVLAFAFEASLMAGQAQQNAITRKLAAWAAILAVPTAVAGIYGMNFQNMPELHWKYGYYVVIAAIVALCGRLYLRFKRLGWL